MRSVALLLAALLAAAALGADCPNGGGSSRANSKLFCYFGKVKDVDACRCSFVILPADADVKAVERARGVGHKGARVLVTVNGFNQGLIDILKTSKVDGLEIDLKKLDSKTDIVDFISTVRSKLGSDLYLALSVPARAETLAKYYDFKGLTKHVDAFILQTSFLGTSKNVTFHPSRLSGLWDTQNTDSMVDLVSGMGAPLSKVVISAPVQAFHFTLQDGEYSAPGSPAIELKTITRKELCEEMRKNSNWTLERDQDQAGPYIFSGKNWIAFEDSSSIDVKAKYARVRGLAGMALKDLSQDDGGKECGPSVLEAAHEGLTRQARAPRGAVLHSLERELQGGAAQGALAGVRVSPYRISRVIDVEGHIHVVRQDTRTEFTCSRQGFFAHPRSCNRFYRCVLFDQTSDEFSVFEFDCPAGLAFDERVEVCVWPGSLPEGRPCAGSSEIAPVPRTRFVCPHEPGYYADPENCRWFFACLDHGNSPLSAYEFRCPYGLVFDSDRLMCEWPWLVPRCASSNGLGINLGQEYVYGGSGHASANALDYYNGLGSLGVVKLGGLSGQIQQPIVYSNVGGGVYPSVSLGGLGIKATQSLVSAGLLRGTNIYDNNVQYSSGAAHSSGSLLGGSSANHHSFGTIGSAERGSGRFSYDSNSGLDSSSLNLQSGSGNNDGSGSYSFNSNSGLGSSTLNLQAGSGNDAGSGSYSYNSNLGLDSSSLNLQSGSGNNEGSRSYSYNSNSGLGSSSLNLQSGSGNNVGSGSYNYNSNSGLGSSSLNLQSGSGNNLGSGSYNYNSNSGLDSSSLNLQSSSGNNARSGSYSFNSNSGLGSSSLNLQSSSGNDAGSGSYNYNSNSGLDSSSLHSQSSSGNNARSGSYSYNSNSGLGSSTLNLQAGSGNDAGSGSYSYNSNSGLDSSSLNLQSASGSSQNKAGSGSYSYISNSGLDSSSLNQKSGAGSSQQNAGSGSFSYLLNTGPGLSHQTGNFHNSASGGYISDTVLGLEGTNSFGAKTTNHDSLQNNGGSGSYFVNSNLGHDASSLDSTQQQLNSDNEGSYHGIIQSGLSQYQGSSIGESGSIFANTNSGTKSTQQLSKENGIVSNRVVHFGSSQYQGSSNDGSYVENSHSGVDTSSLLGTQQVSEENDNQRIVQFGSSQYQNANGATALDTSSLFGTKTTQQQLNENNDGSYNSIVQSGSSQYQGSSNDESNNYIVSSNTGKDDSSLSGIRTSHVLLNNENRGAQNGGSSSYSYSYSGQGGATDFGAKSSQNRLNIKSAASGSYNSLDSQVGDGIGIQVGYDDSRTDNLGLVHQSQIVGNGDGHYSEQSYGQNQQNFENDLSSQYHHGVSGNINIVGGGYSAVRQSNVQVSHNGENSLGLVQTTSSSVPTITSSPVSIATYSSIPTVTSVPVPTLSTPTSFGHFNGGVVANIPQLQYQVVGAGLSNISSGFVSSTPYSISLGNRQYSNGATSYNYQSQLSHGSESSEVQGLSSDIKSEVDASQSRGYIYNKPSIPFEESPKVNRAPIITHTYIPSTTVSPHPEVSFQTHNSGSGFQGYNYDRPSVAFEENPLPKVTPVSTISVQPQVIVSSTVSPVVPVQSVSHAYSQTVRTGGYQYPKPSVVFIERPSQPTIISRFSIKKHDVQRTHVRPSIAFQESPIQPVVQSTIRPAVFNYQQPVQKTSYTFQDVIQPVSTYLPVTEKQITVRPVVSSYYYKKPAVSSYTFNDIISQTTARPIQQTYSYSTTSQPAVIHSSIRPALSYFPSTEQPAHILVESPASTYLPVTQRPAVVSSYNYVNPTTARPVYTYSSPTPASYVPQLSIERQNNVNFRGYDYPKPTVSFEEEPTPSVVTHEIKQPVEEVPFVKKTAYVTGNIHAVNPVVVENYQAANYEKVKSKLFGQSAGTGSETYYNTYDTVSSTPAPIQQVYIQSTPRPTYSSTVASVLAAKSQSGEQESNFHYYDNRYSSAARTETEGYLYPKPTIAFQEEPALPTREYLPSTTSRPILRYSFSSLDDQNQYVSQDNIISAVSSTTAIPREYLPVRQRVRVTTPLPTYEVPVSTESSTLAREYLPARSRVRFTTPEPTYAVPIVSVPSRSYLPGRSRVSSTTALPSREYLPVDSTIRVTTDGAISGNLEVSSRRPVKLIKVVRPRTKTIIKQNDMHPILSAKLGAQCTCLSNSINLKKNQRIIVVEDDDDDDGYVVGNDGQSGTVIENYQYEPQKVVDITPTPDVYVQSTTNEPSPKYYGRRVRVRPSTTVAYEGEEEEDDSPSDKEIAKAVRTGLKLVKQAAKEGAKEGAEEVISNYSPRTGNSREGIECQRAGLFRHPNQCNKFYSCKWDCKKNKYTLHVFDCPVHLTFDNNLGACNWPSQGPACTDDTLLPNE